PGSIHGAAAAEIVFRHATAPHTKTKCFKVMNFIFLNAGIQLAL
ncbi:MAG: hypothetical protein ACJARK_001981, partial [Marinobacter psychrophilus]